MRLSTRLGIHAYLLRNVFVAASVVAILNNVQGQTTAYSGVVVDELGKPLAGSLVQLIPECGNCPIDVIESNLTDQDGRFRLFGENNKRYRVFVEQMRPAGYWLPIHMPEWQLNRIIEYRGIPVGFNGLGQSDLGKIFPTIRYLKAEIEVSHMKARVEEFSGLEIQTRDSFGRQIGKRRNVPKEFWFPEGRLKVALPKGTWVLELFVRKKGEVSSLGSVRIELVSSNKINVQFEKER
jgi:hypothetical protein